MNPPALFSGGFVLNASRGYASIVRLALIMAFWCLLARLIGPRVMQQALARQREDAMHLQGSDGQSIDVTIMAYQFPDTSDYWDGNWLLVSLSVKHPRGEWHSTDPGMLTFEVAELAGWFAAIARGETVSPRIDFTEPNLSFELHDQNGSHHLRAYFELEYRPSWAHARTPSRDLWVEFSLLDVDLPRAADSLRLQLTRFPVKGTTERTAR